MRRVELGRSITVSELCFGTLTIGPLQKGLTPQEGGRLLFRAWEQGVNFFDTAELYGTYRHLAAGLSTHWHDVVIATKSYAPDKLGMEKSLHSALRELGRDYIDIFLLHEQESVHTLRGHAEALEYLIAAREAGYVRAVGISTHFVSGVRAALRYPEIDVIHPLINMQGIGIVDGSHLDMAAAIAEAAEGGKAIYAMKALAGGALYEQAASAISYVRNLPGITAVALGMGSPEDVDANCAFFRSGEFPLEYRPSIPRRRLIVEPWCTGCRQCVARCAQNALSMGQEQAVVDYSLCVTCGYCVAVCPEFNLKVI